MKSYQKIGLVIFSCLLPAIAVWGSFAFSQNVADNSTPFDSQNILPVEQQLASSESNPFLPSPEPSSSPAPSANINDTLRLVTIDPPPESQQALSQVVGQVSQQNYATLNDLNSLESRLLTLIGNSQNSSQGYTNQVTYNFAPDQKIDNLNNITVTNGLTVASGGLTVDGNLSVSGSLSGTTLLSSTNASTTQLTTTGNTYLAISGGNVGIGTTGPDSPLSVQGSNTSSVTGSELLTNTADQDFSSDTGNWSGTGWSIAAGVATHTAGANSFTHTLSSQSGETYQITFTLNTTAIGTLAVSFGSTPWPVSNLYFGQSLGAVTQVVVFAPISAGNLTFTPDANWTGTLDNVSVKEITPSSVTQKILNSDGTTGIEIRSGGSGTNNIFMGIGGTGGTSGNSGNTAIGNVTFISNTTGYNNTVVGGGSLVLNTTGNGNAAFGFIALTHNTTGGSNDAFGYWSLHSNVSGSQNNAMGYQSLASNTTGSNNTALGGYAGQSGITNTTETGNTFIGYGTGLSVAGITNATAIGYNARVGSSNAIVLGGTGGYAVNVGIGTTSPTSLLQVSGATPKFYLSNTSGAVDGKHWFLSNASGDFSLGTTSDSLATNSTYLTVKGSTGNVGIGTTTPSRVLDISAARGNAIAAGWDVWSSEKYKNNITYLGAQDYSAILAAISGINIATYFYNGEQTCDLSSPNCHKRMGLIAEDAPREVLSVSGDSISLYDLASYTLAGVKALGGQMNDMEARIKDLESKSFNDSLSVLGGDNSSLLAFIGSAIESGLLKFKSLTSRTIVIEKTADPKNDSIGEGVIKAGETEAKIVSSWIKNNSKVFVTFRNDYGSRWWIAQQGDGYFTLKITQPLASDIKFDWWIIGVAEPFVESLPDPSPSFSLEPSPSDTPSSEPSEPSESPAPTESPEPAPSDSPVGD